MDNYFPMVEIKFIAGLEIEFYGKMIQAAGFELKKM